eukprot:5530794-Pyramimonas_sp.AAC.1
MSKTSSEVSVLLASSCIYTCKQAHSTEHTRKLYIDALRPAVQGGCTASDLVGGANPVSHKGREDIPDARTSRARG